MILQATMSSLFFLTCLLAAAVYFDFRSHRIPNALTLGGAVSGLVLVMHGDPTWQTLALSSGGALLGLLLFMPLYMLGKMGAGDVKLLGMVGVFVGPIGVFWASLWTLIAGGLLAVLWITIVFGIRQMAYRTLGTIVQDRPDADTGRSVPSSDDEDTSPLQSKMPYAAAIAVGSIVAARLQLA